MFSFSSLLKEPCRLVKSEGTIAKAAILGCCVHALHCLLLACHVEQLGTGERFFQLERKKKVEVALFAVLVVMQVQLVG